MEINYEWNGQDTYPTHEEKEMVYNVHWRSEPDDANNEQTVIRKLQKYMAQPLDVSDLSSSKSLQI
ncbi:MAG: hypothetical protein CM15mV144_190 [Caudoviricetes sp.]|nr:MAG: hypothetical protein CM15mV144_190 [Caudoviricetes sp.]